MYNRLGIKMTAEVSRVLEVCGLGRLGHQTRGIDEELSPLRCPRSESPHSARKLPHRVNTVCGVTAVFVVAGDTPAIRTPVRDNRKDGEVNISESGGCSWTCLVPTSPVPGPQQPQILQRATQLQAVSPSSHPPHARGKACAHTQMTHACTYARTDMLMHTHTHTRTQTNTQTHT